MGPPGGCPARLGRVLTDLQVQIVSAGCYSWRNRLQQCDIVPSQVVEAAFPSCKCTATGFPLPDRVEDMFRGNDGP